MNWCRSTGRSADFSDAHSTAAALAEAIAALPGLDRERLLLFGGWESATRGAGVTLQLVGERLGITDQFQGVDQIELRDDGSFEVLERVEGGKHQVSVCAGAPAVLGWATGNLAEPRNNPQIGMQNMRGMMPALQKAKAATAGGEWPALRLGEPAQAAARDARGEEHGSRRDRARAWCGGLDRGVSTMETILVLTHVDESGAALTKASLEAVTAGRGAVAADGRAAGDWDSRARLQRLRRARWRRRGRACWRFRARRSRRRAMRAMRRGARRCAGRRRRALCWLPRSARFARVAAGVAHRLGGFIDTHITGACAARERSRRRAGSIASGWKR